MTIDSELILGGARSGKSRIAEQKAMQSGMQRVYIATGTAGDEEMANRIAHHKQSRGDDWQLVEEPIALAAALLKNSSTQTCILVDCLTLWLSNCLHRGCWEDQRQALIEMMPTLPGKVIFVSNEVGQGVVPMGELSRQFVDESGFLHQELAQLCDGVTFVAAGLPLQLKPMVNS